MGCHFNKIEDRKLKKDVIISHKSASNRGALVACNVWKETKNVSQAKPSMVEKWKFLNISDMGILICKNLRCVHT